MTKEYFGATHDDEGAISIWMPHSQLHQTTRELVHIFGLNMGGVNIIGLNIIFSFKIIGANIGGFNTGNLKINATRPAPLN